ncbi:metabotropic glutamate receptor 6-like [Saccostrea echinata]|uniref:metabotropic glutamate receptor 6-like n=1 Tax=Saccostrea echinata TaxID=191078 RepID=UPI002A8049E4|nr:metabotropic glutamate receptor 6-like [Saccostrea echinata]
MRSLHTLLFLAAVLRCAHAQSTCPAASSGPCLYTKRAILPVSGSAPNLHYYIGGLFGVHERVNDAYACASAPIREEEIINLEAFLWAIEKYKTIHPTVSIGGVAFDTCSRYQRTLEDILSFETCKVQLNDLNPPSPRNLLAYIGPGDNYDAMSSARLLKDMNKTQVSYAASSSLLSDKGETYDFFLRTVPSDAIHLKALSMLIATQLNAKYVQVLYIDNEFGHAQFKTFKEDIEKQTQKVCIVHPASIPAEPSAADLSTLANAVYDRRSVRHVVLLAPKGLARSVLEKLKDNFKTKDPALFSRMMFFGTWDSSVVDGLDVSSYATSLQSPTPLDSDVAEFYRYLNALKPKINTRNKEWFTEYWNAKLNCATRTCNEDETLENKYSRSPYVPYTLAAVKAVIQGIKNGATKACSTGDLCSNYLNTNNRGQQIYTGIINTTDGAMHYFQASGQMKGDASNSFSNLRINLYEAQAGRAVQVTHVADYNPASGLNLLATLTTFSSSCPNTPCLECNETLSTTTSTASPTSQVMVSTTTDPTEGGKYAMLRYPYDEEMTGIYAPSGDRDLYGTRFKIGQKWIIALGVLAGLGILAVLVFEVYILYKLIGTSIGRQWRTMWLGQLLLLGILLSYLTLFAFIFIPTDATCGITRFGVGFCYAIIFAVLLVKLMVLLTSKSSESIFADMESPNYLKGIYQFLMFMFAVGVQVVINVQWLIQVPPYAVKVTANYGGEEWICNHFTWQANKGWSDMQDFVRTPFENHLLSLLYIMFLILMTTIVAMKAHGIITNHRESVFIGIAAGFSIPVWIAWGLVGGLNRDDAYGHEYGDACIAFGLFTTATLCLFSLFLPKVRQLVNMGVEGIYLEDDRDTYYAGSVVMAPPSYKSRPSSMVYVNSAEYSNPVVIGNGDPNHLKHPGSMYSGHSAPVYTKRNDMGSSRVLRVTGDLTGKHPTERKRPVSEIGYTGYAGSYRKTRSESGGTLRKARSQRELGAL